MKLFLTKTWGWSPETHPTFGFSTSGAREKFLRESAPGDWIVIAGTRDEPTPVGERGCLLGMCQVGRELVDADAIMKSMGVDLNPHELDDDGQYRWPWAMPIVRAVRFRPPRDTREIVGSYLPGQEWAAFAIDAERRFGPALVDRILSLEREPCEIANIPLLDREVAYAEAMALHRKYGSSGPPPTAKRSGSEREMGVGYAYAFKLVGGLIQDAVKIGSTHHLEERRSTLNKELRFHLTGCRWDPALSQIFPSESFAYQFEQLLLRRLRAYLLQEEREVVSMPLKELSQEWSALFFSKDWTSIDVSVILDQPAPDGE